MRNHVKNPQCPPVAISFSQACLLVHSSLSVSTSVAGLPVSYFTNFKPDLSSESESLSDSACSLLHRNSITACCFRFSCIPPFSVTLNPSFSASSVLSRFNFALRSVAPVITPWRSPAIGMTAVIRSSLSPDSSSGMTVCWIAQTGRRVSISFAILRSRR
jgi:hypothetical protein